VTEITPRLPQEPISQQCRTAGFNQRYYWTPQFNEEQMCILRIFQSICVIKKRYFREAGTFYNAVGYTDTLLSAITHSFRVRPLFFSFFLLAFILNAISMNVIQREPSNFFPDDRKLIS
jgi:hypothetical protein